MNTKEFSLEKFLISNNKTIDDNRNSLSYIRNCYEIILDSYKGSNEKEYLDALLSLMSYNLKKDTIIRKIENLRILSKNDFEKVKNIIYSSPREKFGFFEMGMRVFKKDMLFSDQKRLMAFLKNIKNEKDKNKLVDYVDEFIKEGLPKGYKMASLTQMLYILHPDVFAVINKISKPGLEKLDIYENPDKPENYLKILEKLDNFRKENNLYDFVVIDKILSSDIKFDVLKNNLVNTNYKNIISNFKQVIFYGPPGTGKTREAKRIAYQLIYPNKSVPEKEEDLDNELEESKQFKIVVFHPSYEYDDFMVGIKPVIKENGEKLAFVEKIGAFLELCNKAKVDENKNYVIIIDEINRGNLPKILGELVYALEYRKSTIKLPVTGEDFKIPENVYIIGTMNSADRSIGHIDVAIRRRFALVYMGPDIDVVKNEWESIDKQLGEDLSKFMANLNKILQEMAKNSGIVVDEREIGIGHSYFLPVQEKHKGDPKEYINQKWKYFVLPLLKEYAVQFGIGDLKDILECEDIDSARQKIKPEKEKNEPANSGDKSKPAEQ